MLPFDYLHQKQTSGGRCVINKSSLRLPLSWGGGGGGGGARQIWLMSYECAEMYYNLCKLAVKKDGIGRRGRSSFFTFSMSAIVTAHTCAARLMTFSQFKFISSWEKEENTHSLPA